MKLKELFQNYITGVDTYYKNHPLSANKIFAFLWYNIFVEITGVVGLLTAYIGVRNDVIKRENFNPPIFWLMVFIGIITCSCIFVGKNSKLRENKIAHILSSVWLCFSPVIIIECMAKNDSLNHLFWGANLICAIFILFTILVLFSNFKIAFSIYNSVFFIYATVSYFVLQVRNIPFLPQDIKSAGTATTVLNNYTLSIDFFFWWE